MRAPQARGSGSGCSDAAAKPEDVFISGYMLAEYAHRWQQAAKGMETCSRIAPYER